MEQPKQNNYDSKQKLFEVLGRKNISNGKGNLDSQFSNDSRGQMGNVRHLVLLLL
jgi:hypothetical protein